MSDTPVLNASVRTEFGKGAARRARRANLVPGVIYGHGEDTIHVDVPGHDLFLLVRGNTNALVELKFDGKSQLALVKDVQRHPVSRVLLHADFLAVKAGEKVDVEVPIVITGESAPGTQHNVEEFNILVKAPATAIPDSIEVDITGLEAGTVLRVADLAIPANIEIEVDPEQDIVSIQEIAALDEGDSEAGEAAEGEAGEAPAAE
ncbi:50S ribosomal protein L25/general stress protein Ctc [Schaalia sp. ZJ405]|uniref:50S ribosomal protein L25/general stress protein Ctc n=1 Tax=unclassified Schaalia TaxID=2691889 RepID=UPI0013EACCC5|nr:MULTISPECIES: 50S ribosomal protein L25/general stress protein Ctc [unclassified Schaalia]QPK81664.1 50S ribosomal protein L25/general stress protein Ctc [Schaalia sp. ZJ405]